MSYLKTSRSKTSKSEFVGKALIVVIGIICASIVSGWQLSLVWNWFIPNIFSGAPRLNIGGAIGISLIVGLLTDKISDDEDDSFLCFVFSGLLMPVCLGFLFVFVAYIVQALTY